jgi:hypothetical protein
VLFRSDAACVAYSTKTTKTTITAMTNAAIAMVRVSMTSSLRLIVLARAPAPWRTGDLETKVLAISTNTSDQTR